MTLEEAIKHAEEIIVENLEKTKGRNASDPIAINCFKCAEEHRQLAEWLKDYKRLKEQDPCENTIDRSAALDAISRIGLCKCSTNEIQAVSECLRAVESLPSVTPKYTDVEIQKMQELEQAEIKKAYEIGKDEEPNKWIPVSERLPKLYEEVIVTDIETTGTYLSRYIGNGHWECDNGLFDNRIIAWMPLPKPYEPQESEG